MDLSSHTWQNVRTMTAPIISRALRKFLNPLSSIYYELIHSSAVWFKVAEAGRVGTSDVWGDTPLMSPGNAYTFTVPSCLAAGSYIVRNEIIALHTAGEYPGVQFYPSCFQIAVTGSGTSTGPTTKVSFPGAYAPTDPGITYDMYIAQTYTIPGPTLFTC